MNPRAKGWLVGLTVSLLSIVFCFYLGKYLHTQKRAIDQRNLLLNGVLGDDNSSVWGNGNNFHVDEKGGEADEKLPTPNIGAN
jgi:hypothetical protein